jgi:dephospho-CoA kinase
MLRIGITGGIGSGKTTVTKIFGLLGVPVYYADDAAKRMMNEDEELMNRIVEQFGSNAYDQGRLNRKYLASIVFNNKEKLELLNSLVHPATIIDAEKWMQRQTTPYAIKEAALIFESGAHANLDYVIGVSAPQELRITRAMERENISREQVIQRMRKQINEAIKMRLCDFVIRNDEREGAIPQVMALHEKLTELARSEEKAKPPR